MAHSLNMSVLTGASQRDYELHHKLHQQKNDAAMESFLSNLQHYHDLINTEMARSRKDAQSLVEVYHTEVADILNCAVQNRDRYVKNYSKAHTLIEGHPEAQWNAHFPESDLKGLQNWATQSVENVQQRLSLEIKGALKDHHSRLCRLLDYHQKCLEIYESPLIVHSKYLESAIPLGQDAYNIDSLNKDMASTSIAFGTKEEGNSEQLDHEITFVREEKEISPERPEAKAPKHSNFDNESSSTGTQLSDARTILTPTTPDGMTEIGKHSLPEHHTTPLVRQPRTIQSPTKRKRGTSGSDSSQPPSKNKEAFF